MTSSMSLSEAEESALTDESRRSFFMTADRIFLSISEVPGIHGAKIVSYTSDKNGRGSMLAETRVETPDANWRNPLGADIGIKIVTICVVVCSPKDRHR